MPIPRPFVAVIISANSPKPMIAATSELINGFAKVPSAVLYGPANEPPWIKIAGNEALSMSARAARIAMKIVI